jgi:hypothetical protein
MEFATNMTRIRPESWHANVPEFHEVDGFRNRFSLPCLISHHSIRVDAENMAETHDVLLISGRY